MTRSSSSAKTSASSSRQRGKPSMVSVSPPPPLMPAIATSSSLLHNSTAYMHDVPSSSGVSDTPDTPPPLAEARLPPLSLTRLHAAESLRSSHTSTPDAVYQHSPPSHQVSPAISAHDRLHSPGHAYSSDARYGLPRGATAHPASQSQWPYRAHSQPYHSEHEHTTSEQSLASHEYSRGRQATPAMNGSSQIAENSGRQYSEEPYSYATQYDLPPMHGSTLPYPSGARIESVYPSHNQQHSTHSMNAQASMLSTQHRTSSLPSISSSAPTPTPSRHSIAHISNSFDHSQPQSHAYSSPPSHSPQSHLHTHSQPPSAVSPLESPMNAFPVSSVAAHGQLPDESPGSSSIASFHDPHDDPDGGRHLTPITLAPHSHPHQAHTQQHYDSSALSSVGYGHPLSEHTGVVSPHGSGHGNGYGHTHGHAHGAYPLSSAHMHGHAHGHGHGHSPESGSTGPHLLQPVRWDSPPPVLAPIQDERVIRGEHDGAAGVNVNAQSSTQTEEPRSSQSHSQSQGGSEDGETVSSYGAAHQSQSQPHHHSSESSPHAQHHNHSPHEPLPPISAYSSYNGERAPSAHAPYQLRPISGFSTSLSSPASPAYSSSTAQQYPYTYSLSSPHSHNHGHSQTHSHSYTTTHSSQPHPAHLHQPQPQHASGHQSYLSHYSYPSLPSTHHTQTSWRVEDVR